MRLPNFQQVNDPFARRLERRRNQEPDAFTQVVQAVLQDLERADRLKWYLPKLSGDRAKLQQAAQGQRKCVADSWERHIFLRQEMTPLSSAQVKQLFVGSWIAYTRHALIQQQLVDALASEDASLEVFPAVLGQRITDFDYVNGVRARKNLVLSNQLLGEYSPQVLHYTLVRLTETLDACGWTPSAHALLVALFWRYALILHYPERRLAGPSGVFAARTDDECAPPLSPARLKMSFLTVMERIFFHHLWRSRAIVSLSKETFWLRSVNVVVVRDWAAWRQGRGRDLFAVALRDTLNHPMLGGGFGERVGKLLLDRFLLPAEREQKRFEYADEGTGDDTDATQVLYAFRLDMYKRLQPVMKSPAHELLDRYLTGTTFAAAAALGATTSTAATTTLALALGRDGTEGGIWEEVAPKRDDIYERVALLLFQVVFDIIGMASGPGPVFHRLSYSDDRAALAPGDLPPSTRSTITTVLGAETGPFFVAIWGVYFVFEPTLPVCRPLVITPHLLDALVVWLRAAVAGQHLTTAAIRDKWKAWIDSAPPTTAAASNLLE